MESSGKISESRFCAVASLVVAGKSNG